MVYIATINVVRWCKIRFKFHYIKYIQCHLFFSRIQVALTHHVLFEPQFHQNPADCKLYRCIVHHLQVSDCPRRREKLCWIWSVKKWDHDNPAVGPLVDSLNQETNVLKYLSLFFSIPPPGPPLVRVDQHNRAKPLKIQEEQTEDQRTVQSEPYQEIDKLINVFFF